eukprot:360089-Chlamydomonas_euryale.AAC.5
MHNPALLRNTLCATPRTKLRVVPNLGDDDHATIRPPPHTCHTLSHYTHRARPAAQRCTRALGLAPPRACMPHPHAPTLNLQHLLSTPLHITSVPHPEAPVPIWPTTSPHATPPYPTPVPPAP